MDARNRLLEEMTDEVSHLVLGNNIAQSLAVSLDQTRSREALDDFSALVDSFEREGLLERVSEGIPARDEIADRVGQGIGLTRPTLCVLLAYAKLQTAGRLLETPLPDEPALASYLRDYFPRAAVEVAGEEGLVAHPLRREIVATTLVSDLVNLMGASFVFRVARDSGQEIEEVVRAWYIASQLAGAEGIRVDLGRLEASFSAATVHRWLFALERVLERTTRWVLSNVDVSASSAAVLDDHLTGLLRLREEFPEVVTGGHREIFHERMGELRTLGVEEGLAARLITLRFLPELLDIMRIARESSTDELETGRAYYMVSEHFEISWLQQAIRQAKRGDSWEKRLAQTLLVDVGRAHQTLTRRVLACEVHAGDMERCLDDIDSQHSRQTTHFRELLEELHEDDPPGVAALAVAVGSLLEVGR